MSVSLNDRDYFSALQGTAGFSDAEGQLSVDVIETDKDVIVRSAVAGVKADDIDVSVTDDTVTIRGERKRVGEAWERQGTVHVQECHWGAFSRSIVLPCHIRSDAADAVLKDGVLTLTLPKKQRGNRLTIIDDSDL